jgi:hypothetical protein
MLIGAILFESGSHFNSWICGIKGKYKENEGVVQVYVVDFVSEMKLVTQLRMLKY